MKNTKSGNTVAQKEWLRRLQRGEEEAYRQVYRDHKEEFVNWSRQRFKNVSRDSALEIFQDAVVALLDHAVRGQLEEIEAGPKTYLFAVGKYKLYERNRRKERTTEEKELAEVIEKNQYYFPADQVDKQEVDKVRKALGRMAEPCRSLLNLFYLGENSTEAIAYKLGYKNTDVVKSQKIRCLRKLRNILGYEH